MPIQLLDSVHRRVVSPLWLWMSCNTKARQARFERPTALRGSQQDKLMAITCDSITIIASHVIASHSGHIAHRFCLLCLRS